MLSCPRIGANCSSDAVVVCWKELLPSVQLINLEGTSYMIVRDMAKFIIFWTRKKEVAPLFLCLP